MRRVALRCLALHPYFKRATRKRRWRRQQSHPVDSLLPIPLTWAHLLVTLLLPPPSLLGATTTARSPVKCYPTPPHCRFPPPMRPLCLLGWWEQIMLVAVIEGLIIVPDTDACGTMEGRMPARRMLIVRINYIGGKALYNGACSIWTELFLFFFFWSFQSDTGMKLKRIDFNLIMN